jgi:hypothetical protein
MRRITTALLLILLTCPMVTPLLAINSQSDLPACCRRNGKHHCTGNMRMPASDETQVTGAGMKCPMFPTAALVPGHNTQISPNTSQVFYAAIAAHPAIHAQVESFYRICWSRSQQKRGSPELL